jgi:predicted ester cyclase
VRKRATGKERRLPMSEENKAIARRVYEIISTGEFERAEEVVDPDAPDNECPPGMERPRLIDTFKEAFSEVRQAFPDVHVTVEDAIAEDDRVAARCHARNPPGRVSGHNPH